MPGACMHACCSIKGRMLSTDVLPPFPAPSRMCEVARCTRVHKSPRPLHAQLRRSCCNHARPDWRLDHCGAGCAVLASVHPHCLIPAARGQWHVSVGPVSAHACVQPADTRVFPPSLPPYLSLLQWLQLEHAAPDACLIPQRPAACLRNQRLERRPIQHAVRSVRHCLQKLQFCHLQHASQCRRESLSSAPN